MEFFKISLRNRKLKSYIAIVGRRTSENWKKAVAVDYLEHSRIHGPAGGRAAEVW